MVRRNLEIAARLQIHIHGLGHRPALRACQDYKQLEGLRKMRDGVSQAAQALPSQHVSCNTDDEELIAPFGEDHLRWDAGIGTSQNSGKRHLGRKLSFLWFEHLRQGSFPMRVSTLPRDLFRPPTLHLR